ncbi:hypothetical protein TrRE_jg6972, partial [Triparma retinervis]
MAFIGRCGVSSLAALGACTSVFHLSFNCFRGTTAATTTLIARTYDPKLPPSPAAYEQHLSRRKIVKVSLAASTIFGLIITTLMTTLAPSVLSLMGLPPTSKTKRIAIKYLRIRATAAVAVVGASVLDGVYRGMESSLLLAWAYSTRKAALLGSAAAAAHQIGLTSWLLFALVSEGPSIASQVIAAKEDTAKPGLLTDLTKYTLKLAAAVGAGSAAALWALSPLILRLSCDPVVRDLVRSIMGPICAIQPLIAATLMLEGLA